MSRTLRYVCLGALLILCAQSQTTLQLSLDSFDHVWKTINEKHFDPKLNGIDWNAAREELRPKVAAASTKEEARQHTEALLAKLGHSHVGIIPAEAYRDLDSPRLDGQSGLKFEIIGGDAILANTPHAGAVIREVNGRRVRDRIARATTPTLKRIAVRNMLSGNPGETLELLLENEQGTIAAHKVELTKPSTRLAQFGHLPPIPLDLHFEQLGAQSGYIRISSFFDPEALQDLFKQATTTCNKCRGLIIDLRDNPGGIGALATAVTGWFIEKSATLGTLYFRQTKLQLIANPRPVPFLGKVAVLINANSISTAEFLAAGLKDIHRAKVFGQTTAGMALPSAIEMLPTGDGFQYTTADYITAGGKHIEGIGVTPDVLIEPTRQQLTNKIDPALQAARHWIDEKE
jgi:carboxyl-terminal processing protease